MTFATRSLSIYPWRPTPRVALLVPAHNEADSILRTLQCLDAQTSNNFDVLVICDNCTDNTKEIVQSHGEYAVHVTEGNEDRKAGALNRGWRQYTQEYELVMTMDADTVLRPDFVEKATGYLDNDPELGGVCARFFAGNTGGLVGRLQRLEYARYDERRLLKDFWVPVLSGTAVMYRNEALRAVRQQSGGRGPFDPESIVEDYKLTLQLKENGWTARAGKDLKVITDNPTTWSGLWTQRVRWTRGTIDHMREFGYTDATREDYWDQVKAGVFLSFKVMWVLLLIVLLVVATSFEWPLVWVLPILLLVVERATSLYTLDDRNWKDYLVSLLILPDELLYQSFRMAWCTRSYYLSITQGDQSWR